MCSKKDCNSFWPQKNHLEVFFCPRQWYLLDVLSTSPSRPCRANWIKGSKNTPTLKAQIKQGPPPVRFTQLDTSNNRMFKLLLYHQNHQICFDPCVSIKLFKTLDNPPVSLFNRQDFDIFIASPKRCLELRISSFCLGPSDEGKPFFRVHRRPPKKFQNFDDFSRGNLDLL